MQFAAPVVLNQLQCKAVLDHATPVLTAPPPYHNPFYATAHLLGWSPLTASAMKGRQLHAQHHATERPAPCFSDTPRHIVCRPTPVIARQCKAFENIESPMSTATPLPKLNGPRNAGGRPTPEVARQCNALQGCR
jgi:hypothetical protein